MKRIIDFLISTLLLVGLVPMLATVAVFSRIFLGSPVLFRHRRPGKNGQPFTLYKFRTMLETKDEQGNLLPDEQRVSKWGEFLRRWSIDELPELWNVFRGQMSLVGPRPLLEKYLPLYTERQARRHEVTPGITGWAQVNGRNNIEWNQKLELDVWYVENQSFFLDIKILFLTFFKVLKRDGISRQGHVTSPEFDGGKSKGAYIIGAGGHGRVVLSLLRAVQIPVLGFLDDRPAHVLPPDIDGVPLLGGLNRLEQREIPNAILAIGDNRTREKMVSRFPNVNWITAIHPSAIVDPSVSVGKGSVIFAGCVVQPRTKVGDHVILNSSSSIDHDCQIGDFSHLAPGTHLAGNVIVEPGALMGVGSSAIPGSIIGAWSTVGAGGTVVSPVPTGSIAVGTPARPRPAPQTATAPAAPVRLPVTQNGPVALSDSDIGPEDIAQVVSVLKSKRLALGPKITEFEKAMADKVGAKHAVALNSGTAALHLIVKALGIGPGDEVIVPSFTFVASVNAILFEGATPIFVDIDPHTRNLDPENVQRRITPRTKAIMAVDIFGHPAEWDHLNSIARTHGLKLIDDSCEALGAEYRGRKLGTFGAASSFAFYPNKQITTGEGGMIVTDSSEIAGVCRSLLNQGRDESGQWLHHVRLGYNYRMDEMSAALGISQLAKLDSIVERRAQVAGWYTRLLSNEPWVICPVVREEVKMSWFVYVIELAPTVNREALMTTLEKRGIPTRAYFSPVHEQPYIAKNNFIPRFQLPVTERLSRKTLALPFHTNLSQADVERVVRALKEAVLEQLGNRRQAA